MKLATYAPSGSQERIGLVLGNGDASTQILDLAAAARQKGLDTAPFASMLTLIEAGPQAWDQARALEKDALSLKDCLVPLSAVVLKAPVPRPVQMRDASVFPGHVIGAPAGAQRVMLRAQGQMEAAEAVKPGTEVPKVYQDRPIFYITNRMSVIGTGVDVIWPRYSKYMDFELEFGVFLGKGGKNISKAEAKSHIFGYCIYNDFSARDMQFIEMQGMLGPAKGKSFDCGNVLGPWIVTPDEIGDPYALKVQARINGEVWTDTTTAGMLHDFEAMIAYISQDETLYAGEFIGSGTVGGGCGLELDRPLKAGDVVELSVEKIGVIKNRVLRQD